MQKGHDVTFLAQTNSRSDRRIFGIRQPDRRSHMWIVGKTGTGKSTLLQNLVQQDMQNGNGLALLDPHGDLAERVAATVPDHRRSDLVYFNVPDRQRPLHWNPVESVAPDHRPRVAGGLLVALKKMWPDAWGARLEHILRNSLLTLLDQPQATLADLLRLLDDDQFRRRALDSVQNEQVRRFWREEYAHYPLRYRAEMLVPIQNKVGAFLADPVLNAIFSKPTSDFNLREIMDHGKILIVNLSKGHLGEDSSGLLGALLIAQMGSAAFSRADTPEGERRDFYLYLDEFQTYTTLSLATMLSELRKHRVSLLLSNQYLAQIERPVLDAILGNVGTMITFRVGPSDAAFLSREFSPKLDAGDLMNLSNYDIYLRLMIDGTVSEPFSATTLPPPNSN